MFTTSKKNINPNNLRFKNTKISFTLVYYLLKLFLPAFFVALTFFILVLELGDTFFNLTSFMENSVPFKTILKIIVLFAPKCVSYSMPISMLFAGSYTIGNLHSKKELPVIFSSGISLLKFVMPILIFAFLCSVGMLFFEDKLVIKTFAEKNKILMNVTNKDKNLDSENIAVMSNFGETVYVAEYYNDTDKFLHKPKIIHRNSDGLLNIVITAENAVWNDEQKIWTLENSNVYRISENNQVKLTNETSFEFLTEPPESFQRIIADIETMSAAEARNFLEKLKQNGLSATEYLVKYYQRFSFPFTIFIVLFLSISFGGNMQKNVLLMSLLLSLSFAVLYYVTQMLAAVLASWNIISPIVGAWSPFLIFFFLSLFLLQKAKT